ncbi:MAG: OsmC family protein [candidate division Zixibacteria bacterium]|nr:OsmC family protein [candidate division Zixibacteria bacterium]
MDEKQLTVQMEQIDNYQFKVTFDEGVELLMDEPEPLGEDKGPSASKVLSAAIGNCLSASLLFCLQKARIDVRGVKTTVTTTMTRNEQKRMRIGGSKVTINIDLDASEGPNRMQKCIELFEDFCVVTASVRKGIDVAVEVIDQNGEILFDSTTK